MYMYIHIYIHLYRSVKQGPAQGLLVHTTCIRIQSFNGIQRFYWDLKVFSIHTNVLAYTYSYTLLKKKLVVYLTRSGESGSKHIYTYTHLHIHTLYKN